MTDQELADLRDLKDAEIDYSDIPPQAGKSWRRVGGARFDFETVVLDKDVQDFFRHDGVVSAERVNAVLREYAEAHRKTA